MHRPKKNLKLQELIEENELSVRQDIQQSNKQLDRLKTDIAFIIRSKVQRFEVETFKMYYLERPKIHTDRSELSSPKFDFSVSREIQEVKHEEFTHTIRHRFLRPKKVESLYQEYFEIIKDQDLHYLKIFLKKNPTLIDQQIYGLTMLYRVVKEQNAELVHSLVCLGANPHLIQEVQIVINLGNGLFEG